MESIPVPLIRSLVQLGLSQYEAQVYAALVMFENSEVKEIVEYLGISKPSVYESLDRLAEAGLALRSNSKPVRYSAVSPEVALDILMGRNQKASDAALAALKKLESRRETGRTSETLWTIYGDTNIGSKIRDMFGNAQRRIECILGERYLPYLEQVKIRDIQLDIAIISRDAKRAGLFKERFSQENVRIVLIDPAAIRIPLTHMTPDLEEMHQHLDFENIFTLITDDDEMLLIPPISGKGISALNTRNKGAIFFIRMLGRGHWGDIFAEKVSAGGIHSLIRKIHGKRGSHVR